MTETTEQKIRKKVMTKESKIQVLAIFGIMTGWFLTACWLVWHIN